MRSPKTLPVVIAVALACTAIAALVLSGGCGRKRAEAERYEQVVRAFHTGVAHLDVGLLDAAADDFGTATELAPEEPAAWANLGLARLRLGSYDEAAESIARAAELAPQDARIAYLQGRLEASRGRSDEALAHLRRAVSLDPSDLHARWALLAESERSGGADPDPEARHALLDLLRLAPENLVVRLEWARFAARGQDQEALREAVTRLAADAASWTEAARARFAELEQHVEAGDATAAARSLAFLRNLLAPTPAFQEGQAEVSTAVELVAEPFDRFLVLPAPSATPSPADTELTYSREPFESGGASAVALVATPLGGDVPPAVFAADGTAARRLDAGGAGALPPDRPDARRATRLLALDWNHDFRVDLLTTGPDGLRLLLQNEGGGFDDATATATGDGASFDPAVHAAWAADVEMDGDLDVVVGLAWSEPAVARNGGDGTWTIVSPWSGVSRARSFAWADLDRDGDPDAAMLDDQGTLHLFANRRAGQFRREDGPADLGPSLALAAADADADGRLDLLVLGQDGAIRSTTAGAEGFAPAAELARWEALPQGQAGDFRLFVADLDNNGALDLVASGPDRSALWLGDESGVLQARSDLPELDATEIWGVLDLDGDGVLDLVGLASDGPVRLLGQSERDYHWQVVRPRAQEVAGDQRINSFGVGGEVEIRSGLLVQKQPIVGLPVHFGLGDRERVDVARIVWPNGTVQGEFGLDADQAIVAEQRLKGSCPWVFAWDGTAMRFVTDFLWRSPLGLRINALDTAGVVQTEDWVRIRGDQLVPRDGSYDVRITGELWETNFFDHVSLLVLDYPPEVEVFVDEGFVASARQPQEIVALRGLRPVGGARDQDGVDVASLVAEQDGRHLVGFERGRYQGIAEDHHVELDLPADVNLEHAWLLAQGWVYPTDSSINVAVAQGSHPPPRGLSLSAQGEDGAWRTVAADLGFPAGKNKTMLVELGVLRRAGLATPIRLRLETNLEVYWDRIAIGERVEDAPIEITRVSLQEAELRYRGFSRTSHPRSDAPETPRYDELANVTQRWRDLAGLYTRFGDVRELLEAIDDRYVIMNAGDELRLLFPAPPAAAETRRAFVLVGDGWVKDGDFNTSHSETVLPLPAHDQAVYRSASPDPDLAADPVYHRHPEDWVRYHTRVVTARTFSNGLWGER